MNSSQRREARYQRRKAKRDKKQREFAESLGSYETVFSYINLYDAFRECKKNVRWKASIQSYEANLSVNTYEIYRRLQNGTWKSKGFTKFYLSERGKIRLIQSVHISERCIQRTFCDHYLVPLLERSLIYDNAASLRGKGTKFALERLSRHLTEYRKIYGTKGFILLYDFTNYFGSIPHDKLFELVDPKIHDDRIRKLYHQLVDAFDEGLGLGSQVSQISEVFFANKLDHTFKDKLGIRWYARYMDDGYIISDDIEKLRSYENVLYEICGELGILINKKKIRICRLEHGFTFLKKTFRYTPGGIEIKLSRASLKACKRRLRKMKEKKIPYRDIWTAYNSWRGSCKGYANWDKVLKMDDYYNKMFTGGLYGQRDFNDFQGIRGQNKKPREKIRFADSST